MHELSDHQYAKYFGTALLEEIFHLDEELTQAVINSKDPTIEDELEREMNEAVELTESPQTDVDREALHNHGWSQHEESNSWTHPNHPDHEIHKCNGLWQHDTKSPDNTQSKFVTNMKAHLDNFHGTTKPAPTKPSVKPSKDKPEFNRPGSEKIHRSLIAGNYKYSHTIDGKDSKGKDSKIHVYKHPSGDYNGIVETEKKTSWHPVEYNVI